MYVGLHVNVTGLAKESSNSSHILPISRDFPQDFLLCPVFSTPFHASSGMKGRITTNKRIGQAWQKAVARLLCGHLFLLCGRRPSVSIVWVKTIMLVGASLSAICFYCVGQNRLFLLWASNHMLGHLLWVIPSVFPSVVSLCPSPREGTCWRYINSSN